MESMELKEYGAILKKRLWLILSFIVVSCTVTGIYNFFFTQSIYQASTKLIVNQSTEANAQTQQISPAQITGNIMLVETYKEIFRTDAIMDQVVARYPELGLTAEQLIRRIHVSSINDTQVMTVSALDPSHEKAVEIVNAVATVFKDTIPTIMKIDNVAILSAAKQMSNPQPVGDRSVLNIVIAFVVALMVAVLLSFILEYLDDSIKSEADIAAVLQLPTYAAIGTVKRKDLESKYKTPEKQNYGEAPYATLNQ